MARRQIIFLVLAAIVGLAMVLLARNLLTAPAPQQKNEAANVQAVRVLIAKNNVPSGSFLQAKDFEWRDWPTTSATNGLYLEGQSSEKDYVGGVLREGVKAGEPLLRARVTMPNEGGFLSAVLRPGMRAMTVKITPTSGVAGLIFPNDRVDVILAHRLTRSSDPSDAQRRVSETVLQNVRVLALDQKTNDQDKKPKVAELATLELTLKQAEKLALVAQMGNLSLVLRSIASATSVDINGDGTSVALDTVPQSALEPMPLPVSDSSGQDATWDSDVSVAVPPPINRFGTERKVNIMRGSDASEVIVPNTVHTMSNTAAQPGAQ